jgi:adenylate kinase family enzyme
VARILVTGMSGAGKSSALDELARRGYRVVDTDDPGWGDGVRWDEPRMTALLDDARDETLFVSGTVENQGAFYGRFDAVVLLSAPREVLLDRIATRTTNRYGKSREERALVLEHLDRVEPLLRAGCTHEIVTTKPLAAVVDELTQIAGGNAPR